MGLICVVMARQCCGRGFILLKSSWQPDAVRRHGLVWVVAMAPGAVTGV